eukprot:5685460-Amphidinium_carterae.2
MFDTNRQDALAHRHKVHTRYSLCASETILRPASWKAVTKRRARISLASNAMWSPPLLCLVRLAHPQINAMSDAKRENF